MSAAVHRSAILALRQRFTFRETRLIGPTMFSMIVVHTSDRGDFRRQADTDGREEVIDPFEDTAADTSRDLFEPPPEIAQHFSGLVGIVEFQCLLSDSFNSVLPQIV
jgi:hypothetical protein